MYSRQTSKRSVRAGSDRTAAGQEVERCVEELRSRVEQSRDEKNAERELEQLLQLYDTLKQRTQEDSDVFEVAFGIARVYDDQLKDSATAVRYYGEALAVLEAISSEATAWSAYMRVTTLGAFALCHENLGQHEEAETYFNDAIGTYNEHCDRAGASGDSEEKASDADNSLLVDLNATAAMIHYHFAGNLLAQERWDEARTVTEIALVLAENSEMPLEELEELQHHVHELWLEME
ncbi:unnamed protein product [Hyaloperonospora brassicae]|uniref:MalT-like TPR region domain-containing protein n=1 Tax=Hyaloperonospora brassicae TaxID=162125 RepID=A0AAV0TGP8_HYABA|nr:unnamed protein product [Hyaloperonospora brassicae]